MFNIQLNYNINQALNLESWDGNFQIILLYELVEHLVSNIKNIKESLGRMQKYILDKIIKGNNANSIKDFKGIGKVVWEFILSLYKVYWDSLVVNNTNISFRNKVKSKFSPQVSKKLTSNKDKNMVKSFYISILSSPILVKLLKEINEISKYFKKKPVST